MINRRALLVSAAAVPLAGCQGIDIAKFQAEWNNFVDQVNGILAAGCGLVPGFIATANSIAAVVAAFYPAATAAIAAGAAAVQAVAGAICSMVPSAPPAQLAAKLVRAAETRIPIVIGNVVINGKVIPIRGYGSRATLRKFRR
jgi:hypothetical protein